MLGAWLLIDGQVQAGPAPRIVEYSTIPVRAASATVADPMRNVPLDIVTGPDGRMWFSMTFGNTIGRIDPATGTVQTHRLEPESYPWYLTTGPDGNVWFADLGATQLRRMSPRTFAPTGTPIDAPPEHTFTALGVGPDRRIWFTTVLKENPYDPENPGRIIASKVGRVEPDGRTTLVELPPSSNPNSITAGPDGNIWFTAVGTDKIGRVDPETLEVTQFALPPGSKPGGIAAGGDGRVWFTQAGTDRIGRMNTTGTLSEITLPGPTSKGLYGITLGPDGAMWFALGNTDQIGQITRDGTVNLFDVPGRSAPVAITNGPDGNLWFTQSYPGSDGVPAANQLGKVVLREASKLPAAPQAPAPAPKAPAAPAPAPKSPAAPAPAPKSPAAPAPAPKAPGKPAPAPRTAPAPAPRTAPAPAPQAPAEPAPAPRKAPSPDYSERPWTTDTAPDEEGQWWGWTGPAS
jgi:streptogramin lyase